MRLHFKGLTLHVHRSFVFALFVVLATFGPGELTALPRLAAEVIAVLLVRELGHALGWRVLGQRTRIVLSWLGGDTAPIAPRPVGVLRVITVLLAGPAATLLLSAAAGTLGLERLSMLALGWGLFSLLPMQPMAGGRIVAALVSRMASHLFSLPVAAASFVLLAAWNAPALALIIVGVAIPVNLALLAEDRRLARDARLAPLVPQIFAALHKNDLDQARARFEELRDGAVSVQRRAEVRKLQAWMHLMAGEVAEALTIVEQLPIGYEADSALYGAIELGRGRLARAAVLLRDAYDEQPSDHAAAQLARALLQLGRIDEVARLADQPIAGPELFAQLMAAQFYAGRFVEAARTGERGWALSPLPLTAFNLACTRARLGEPEAALSWLERALDAGWRDLPGLDEDPDLATLRTRPEWEPLRARLTSLGRR